MTTTKKTTKGVKKAATKRWTLPEGWGRMTLAERCLLAMKRDTSIVRALKAEAAFILKYPHQYNQTIWGAKVAKTDKTPCGTACCIAGGLALQNGCTMRKQVSNWYVTSYKFFKRGEELRADTDFYTRLSRVFGGSIFEEDYDDLGRERISETYLNMFDGAPNYSWIAPFNTRWQKASTPKQYAKVGAARIAHFIRTGE